MKSIFRHGVVESPKRVTNFLATICMLTQALGIFLIPTNGLAQAQFEWITGSDVWSDPAAWVTNGTANHGVPGALDYASFTNAATYTISLTGLTQVSSNEFENGSNTSATVTLNTAGNNFNPLLHMGIGRVGASTSTLYVASWGSFTAQGASTMNCGFYMGGAPGLVLDVGGDGVGILWLTNGWASLGVVNLGNGSGRGTLVVSGPETVFQFGNNSGGLSIGGNSNSFGNSVIVTNGGTLRNITTGSFRLGSTSGSGGSSNNTMTVVAGGQVILGTGTITIGNRSTGTFPGSYNNTLIVGNGGVFNSGGTNGGSHSMIIGTATGNPASNNTVSILSGGEVFGVSFLTITAANTLDLQGGTYGGLSSADGSTILLGGIVTNLGVLQGFGTTLATINTATGGVLYAKSSLGSLVFSNSVSVLSNATLQVELGTSPATTFPMVTASNFVVRAGPSSTLNVIAPGWFDNGTYTLVTNICSTCTNGLFLEGWSFTNFPSPGPTYVFSYGYFTNGATIVTNVWNLNVSGACLITLSATGTNVAAGGGSGGFTVYANNLCSWTAQSSTAWIHTSSTGSGTNTVSYTVDANNGNQRSGTIIVEQQVFTIIQSASPLTASFGANPTSGPAPLQVSFTDSSSGNITNWFWDFGDGITTNFVASTNPTHTYSPGTFSVTLVVRGPPGVSTNTKPNYITALVTISTTSSPLAGGTTGGAGTYTNGSVVTVTATSNACYSFVNWTEGTNVVGTSSNYTFTASANRNLVANFSALGPYTITTSASPPAGGTTSGGGTVNCGSNVTVTATANNGYSFVDWTLDDTVVSSSPSYSFTAGASEALVANFNIAGSNDWITAASGKWETAADWSYDLPPSGLDWADLITNAGTKTVTIDVTTALSNTMNGCLIINNLYIAGTATSTNTLLLNNAGTNAPLQLLGVALTLDTNGVVVANNSAVMAPNLALIVGLSGAGSQMIISNGGQVISDYATLGANASSSTNVVLVTGSSSLWSNAATVYVGGQGANNQLIIANGGQVIDGYHGHIGQNSSGSNNIVLVTGAGSFWTNKDYVFVGYNGPGNQLIITNGGQVVDASGLLGYNNTNSSENVALVTGPGSVWNNRSNLCVGVQGATNQLTIANGGALYDNYGCLGSNSTSSGDSVLVAGAGSVWSNRNDLIVGYSSVGNQLTVTNNGAVFANNLVLAQNAGSSGTLTLAGGTVNVVGLIATSAAGAVVFNSGTLASGGTAVTNGQTFAVGDAVDAATFQLNGGVHSFGNGLEIRNNAALSGCGTISGNVVVDPGGMVDASCGGTLSFTSIVTNNGSVLAINGTYVSFYAPVVNNGLIDNTSGNIHFFSTTGGSGLIITPTNSWTDGSAKWETATNWSQGVAPSSSDAADLVTNAGNNTVTIDATTASNFPGTMTIRNLTVSAPAGATNTLFLNNAGTLTPLQVLGVVELGTNGGMVVNHSAVLAMKTISIGDPITTSLIVSNGGSLIVTNGGTGSVVVNGGSLILGAGTFQADNLVVTNGGTVQNTQTNQIDNAAATVAGGSLVATNAPTIIGSSSNSVASMSVSSNATVLTSLTTLAGGTNSTASLTVQDTATMQVSSNLTAGSGVGSTATVSIVGGQLTATNGVIGIGNNGSTTNGFGYGQMTVSNSSVLANQILLGSSAGGHGDLTIQPNGVVSLVGSNALLVPDGVTINGGELNIDNGQIACGMGVGGSTNFTGALTMLSGAANCMLIYVGDTSAGTLTISGGQMTVSPLMDIGYASGSAGSVWMSGGTLTAGAVILGDSGVGQLSLSNNGIIQVSSSFSVGACGALGAAGTLTVAGGSLTVSVPVIVGAGSVWVNGGQLAAPSLILGYNNYGVGQLTISNGSVQANSLILTNGANSQIVLVGGSLSSGGTVVTNTQRFVVGNGSSAATFAMGGGAHWFGSGLEIANSATLTGCGIVNGNVTIDRGAHAVATCGTLTFSNTVTINGNGVVRALNGSVLNFAGPVVNNGAIDVFNGSATFSVPPTGTGYILTTNCLPVVTAIQTVNSDIHLSFTTGTNAPYAVNCNNDMVTGTWTTLTNVTGTGGIVTIVDSAATLQPKRFYQVNLVVPP